MTREEAIEVLQEKIDNRPLFKDEREAFDVAIESLSADTVSREHHDMEVKELKHQIKDQADMVSVVRCKDCRWWNGNPETMHNNHLCRNWSKFGSINTSADDFCSHGERREE